MPSEPKTRRRELTDFDKSRIISLAVDGTPYGRIASDLDMPRSTVRDFLRRVLERGHLQNSPRSGRPRKTSKQLDHLIMVETETGSGSLTQIQQQMVPNVSIRTIKRRIREARMQTENNSFNNTSPTDTNNNNSNDNDKNNFDDNSTPDGMSSNNILINPTPIAAGQPRPRSLQTASDSKQGLITRGIPPNPPYISDPIPAPPSMGIYSVKTGQFTGSVHTPPQPPIEGLRDEPSSSASIPNLARRDLQSLPNGPEPVRSNDAILSAISGGGRNSSFSGIHEPNPLPSLVPETSMQIPNGSFDQMMAVTDGSDGNPSLFISNARTAATALPSSSTRMPAHNGTSLVFNQRNDPMQIMQTSRNDGSVPSHVLSNPPGGIHRQSSGSSGSTPSNVSSTNSIGSYRIDEQAHYDLEHGLVPSFASHHIGRQSRTMDPNQPLGSAGAQNVLLGQNQQRTVVPAPPPMNAVIDQQGQEQQQQQQPPLSTTRQNEMINTAIDYLPLSLQYDQQNQQQHHHPPHPPPPPTAAAEDYGYGLMQDHNTGGPRPPRHLMEMNFPKPAGDLVSTDEGMNLLPEYDASVGAPIL